MREDEAGRQRAPWRENPIIARIARAGAHLSGAVLLATGIDGSLAARRNRNGDRKNDNDDGESSRDQDGGKERNRDKPRDEDRKADKEKRDVEGEQADKGNRDNGDRNRERDRKNDDDNSSDDTTDVNDEQQNNQDDPNQDDEPRNNDGAEDTDRDGGGQSNAGSGLFDNPLATKARRRSNDFDNRDRNDEEEEDGVFADVDPEAESVYQTDSITFATGPEGVEILTKNITYIAAPTPTPTPVPRLEFPERDGYPFGEDFPFGVARVQETPTSTAPADPGDGARERSDPGDAPPDRTDPGPSDPEPGDTDGGDNSMDFSS